MHIETLIFCVLESPYSTLTYESCDTVTTPRAFTAFSRKLFVEFTSDSNNSAQGFSIPYVMYRGATTVGLIRRQIVVCM